jgi:hypothetical protein
LREGYYLEDIDMGSRIILKRIIKMGLGDD